MNMHFRHSTAAVITTAAFLLVAPLVYGQAQPSLAAQLPDGFRNDPYVRELIQLIGLWNTKDLKVPTREVIIKQLQGRVKSVATTKRYDYQNDAWAEAMMKQAMALPTLEPRARVSDPAALILVALFIKDLDQYKKEVPPNAVRGQLETPLFLILARAQELTKQAEIDAATMTRAVFGWWTAVWPFCDK